MKRMLLLLFALILLAVAFLVAVAVAPARVDGLWRAAGLPPSGIQKLASMLPGDGATTFAQQSN